MSDPPSFDGLTTEQIHELLTALVAEKESRPLDYFEPLPKQHAFFKLGSVLTGPVASERLLVAAIKTGKTYAGAFETACHLTGLYPKWWPGKRFDHPVDGWAACETAVMVRDGAQKYLFGPPNDLENMGTGFIPRSAIIGQPIAGHGATGLFDTARVRHVSGGVSTIQFKAYSQGRANVQSANLHFVWLDEQPTDEELYAEFAGRLMHTRGLLYMTFTPARDIHFVITHFYEGRNATRDYVEMSYAEKPGVTEEEIELLKQQIPRHLWDARIFGRAAIGEGAAFETPERDLYFPPDKYIPPEWPKLWGIDFGITHPFAAVLTAWDRDKDEVFVLEAFKVENAQPIDHAARIRRYAPDVHVAWPHDGNTREKSSGKQLIKFYKDQDLRVLGTHATWPDGGNNLEAGVQEIRYRARSGKLFVKETLADWFREYRGYHTDKNGEYIKVNDDLLAATRYALMMKRYARPGPIGPALPGHKTLRRGPVLVKTGFPW